MKRIAYIVDSLDWIQAQRAKDVQPYLPEYELIPMLPAAALDSPYDVGACDAVLLASWRIALSHPQLLEMIELTETIASVTSHYNLGGGLKPEICFRTGTDPVEEFAEAVGVLRRFRLVTCNSKILYDLLSPHLPEIILAQNGVDAEFFHPCRAGLSQLEKRHGPDWHPDGRPRQLDYCWIGKVKEAKNHRRLYLAARKLENAYGPKPLHRFDIHPVRKDGKHILNRRAVRSMFMWSDFYICLSFHEGTPNPALEAAACGLPIIATSVGNMPELVSEGDTGWFIEPTAESLIACVERLQHLEPHEYRRMSHNIRLVIEAEWTWKIRSEPYRKALETLCG